MGGLALSMHALSRTCTNCRTSHPPFWVQRGKQYRFQATASNGQAAPDGAPIFGPASTPALVITTDACLPQGLACASVEDCEARCCSATVVQDAAGQRFCG